MQGNKYLKDLGNIVKVILKNYLGEQMNENS